MGIIPTETGKEISDVKLNDFDIGYDIEYDEGFREGYENSLIDAEKDSWTSSKLSVYDFNVWMQLEQKSKDAQRK